MSPAEFWELHPDELHWLEAAKRPPQKVAFLSIGEYEDILDELDELGVQPLMAGGQGEEDG